jgi:selenocysteine lyase/cysteine desulfurase
MDPTIRRLFDPEPGLAYLDTATYGLPPRPTMEAMRRALDQWQAGTADWIADFDMPAERARAAFGRLVGVAANRVALLPATSVGVGVVAAGLGPGDEVVVVADEFTSVLFPFLVARDRGVVVREATLDGLAEAITPATTLVATSLVQMQTGRTADLEAILDRAADVGCRVLVDGSQGLPFLGLRQQIDRIDYLVTCAYKHLLSPRGAAFMVLRSERIGDLAPIVANWRAADRPYARFFGGPLTLDEGAARQDVSPAWFSWVGAAESLELLADWAAAGHLAEPLELAERLADGLGVPWGGATLVCVPVDDLDAARTALGKAGIRASIRATGLRFSPHVYNDGTDIERVIEAIAPLVARSVAARR